MSKFTLEVIFIPRTYLSRVPSQKNYFCNKKIQKFHISYTIIHLWKSFLLLSICHKYSSDNYVRNHFEVILILATYLSSVPSKKNIFHKKIHFYHIFNIKSSFLKFIFFLLRILLKYILRIKLNSKMNLYLIIIRSKFLTCTQK